MAFVAQPAVAQQATLTPAANDSDIVVTAQKREERLQKVPISITVLSGKALDKQPVGGSMEALMNVPGLSLTSSPIGDSTSLTIRGVAPGGPFLAGPATVGYYLDSIPFATVKSAAVPDSNIYDMSRIEALRGPQGTLYGASALNGVVRILTNEADLTKFEFKARAGASVTKGGDPSFRGDAALNVPIVQDKLAIRLAGGIERAGGWIEQPFLGKKNANDSVSKNLRVKIGAQLADNLRVDLAAWFSRAKMDTPPYADIDAGNQSTPLPLPQSTRYDAYSGKISYDLPFMTVTSATSYLKLQRISYIDFTYLVPGAQLYSEFPGEVFSEELVLNSKGEGPWRWSVGAFYRDAHDDLYQTLPVVLPGPTLTRNISKSFAVYGQITRTFADDRFEISVGGRYFKDRTRIQNLDVPGGFLPLVDERDKFKAFTPRIVATWLPSPKLTMYASYSQGFRSGYGQGPLVFLTAPELGPVKADKLHNFEVGAKGSLFDGFATYDVSVYYIKWNDVQQLGNVLFNGVRLGAAINGSSASGVGTDIGLTLNPAPGFQVGGSLSYNDLTQDKDILVPGSGLVFYPKGSRLSNSPEITASAFTNYSFALNDRFDVRLNLSMNYHSSQTFSQLASPPVVPVDTVVVFRSGKPLSVDANIEVANHRNQSVSVYVRNLTNWHGILVPPYGVGTENRPRPRTIGIQFETKF